MLAAFLSCTTIRDLTLPLRVHFGFFYISKSSCKKAISSEFYCANIYLQIRSKIRKSVEAFIAENRLAITI